MKLKNQQSTKTIRIVQKEHSEEKHNGSALDPVSKYLKDDLEKRGIYLTDEEIRKISLTT